MKNKRIIVISILILELLLLSLFIFLKKQSNYNGKYIKELSENDKIAKKLLKEIKDFNEKYNGKGGFSLDKNLKIVIYKIKPGDNLWNISKKTGLSIDTLLTLNNLDNVHIISTGTEIRIPNKDGIFYKVSPGETIEDIAKKFNVKPEDIINVNEFSDESIEEGIDIFIPKGKLPLEERLNYLGRFITPLIGRITSGFGFRKNPMTKKKEFHTGIDIAQYYGAPVKASESGEVIFAGEYKGYGNLIILRHNNGYSTRYGHLSKIIVKYGEKVRQGEVIGYVGNSGSVTGPHLHFEIRRYGKAINPYFNMRWAQK